ncbi:MAG TPA: hydroxyacylglutathione hydrolase [Oceanospirillales bacterium]|nr:hydroxyacylglutathione hydrolase [Oceanospirillales bacterium]
MKIHQIFTDNQLRNFTYIIETQSKQAYVIDPWDAEQINPILKQNNLKLFAIINTHEHWDHTKDNSILAKQHACEVWAHAKGEGKIPCLARCLNGNESIKLDSNTYLNVIDTPGHSQAHLCFLVFHTHKPQAIFTGDILFNAGVGNCHNGGNVDALFETINNKISTLADDVKIYPGHDYLEKNLQFTLCLEPSNKIAKQLLTERANTDKQTQSLVMTIADEKKYNTFLRLKNQEIRNNLSLASENDKDVFVALRALRDDY